jgi:hypothetical protein
MILLTLLLEMQYFSTTESTVKRRSPMIVGLIIHYQ